MNRLLLAALVVAGLASLAVADSTDELMISDGTETITFVADGSGGFTPVFGNGTYNLAGSGSANVVSDSAISLGASSEIQVAGTLDGWNFYDATGTSNSPDVTPFGIDLGSLVVSCTVSSCANLTVAFSDSGFTAVVPGFQTSYSLTGGTGGPLSTTQYAYQDSTNALFGTGTLIGTVGPLTGSGTGGISPDPIINNPGAYSLTLVDTFSPVSSGSYSVDGNITAVPEASTFGLLGTGLLGFVGLAARKKKFVRI